MSKTKKPAPKTDKQRIADTRQIFSSAAFLKQKGVKLSDAQLLKAAENALA